MRIDDLQRLSLDCAARPMTRRQALKRAVVVLGGLGVPALVAACGSAASPTNIKPAAAPSTPLPPPTPPPAPTVPAATPGVATTKPAAAATVSVVAADFAFQVDKLSVPAGPIHFAFKNTGKMTHDFWVFPPQDLSAYLAKKRAGEKVKGRDYLKDGTELFDLEGGQSGEADLTLKPGLYEFACFVQSKDPDGNTFIHYDKGQHLTFEVTGPGVASRMAAPAKTMNVVADEWSFAPDTLLVAAGEVTFSFKNNGTMEHDFWVFPLQDRSEYLYRKLKGEKVKGRDFLKGADELFELESGKSETKTMRLTPGAWGAACFILSRKEDGNPFIHSDRGQIFTFTVI